MCSVSFFPTYFCFWLLPQSFVLKRIENRMQLQVADIICTYIHTYTHAHTYIQYTAIVSRELTVGSMTSQLLHLCLYVICLDRDLYKKHRRSMNSRDEQPLQLQFLMNDWINEVKDICASSSRRAPLGSGRGDICGLGMMCQKTL